MSLASVCTNVAADLGIDDPPTPMWGSRQPAARRLIAQARRAQWELLRRCAWANTVIEYEFTADGTSSYPLPPDYLKTINDTVWERSRYWQMRGALSPQQWQLYRSSIYGRATLWRRWRIRVPEGQAVGAATTFDIDPRVAATDTASKWVYEYQSAWAVRQAGTGKLVADWTGDDDETILDEMLLELGVRWRMARRLGLAYDEEKDEYERAVDRSVARDGGTATLNLVPWSRFDDWIGQYTISAFPPVGPGGGQPPNQPVPALPPDIAGRVRAYEQPLLPEPVDVDQLREAVLSAWSTASRLAPRPADWARDAVREAAAVRPPRPIARPGTPLEPVDPPAPWPPGTLGI